MSAQLLAERIRALYPNYEKMFIEREEGALSEPLKFHLHHLALYWNRLVGFCRQVPSKPETAIDTDLGACVAVGSEFTHKLITQNMPVHPLWLKYWGSMQAVLHDRPVTLEDVEAASRSFDECLYELKYDPWGRRTG